jgi:hypothetical protein
MSTTKTISASVAALSKVLSEQIEIKDGVATIQKDAYVGSLPENLTKEMIQHVNHYNSDFYPAVTHAFGEKVIAAMKKDKKLDSITLSTPLMGTDKFELKIDRTRTFPNPSKTGDGEPVVKYCVITPNLITQGARGNRGEMSIVREELSEMAMKALAG